MLPVVLWCAVTVLAWMLYAPALGGTFLLDDFPNLAGLDSVKDWQSALIFSFSGGAGPTGRPLALLTFVPQAEFWGQTAEPFLRVNVLIHLANACILAWVFHRLAILRNLRASEAAFAAIAGAGLWMFMPLLASASLLIIQRMTTLAAFFSLLGLAGYLLARGWANRSPKRALVGMSVALAAGTTLAVLAKENGALLPVFVLVLEATLLQRPQRIERRSWLVWRLVFVVLPTALILGFLISRVPYSEAIVQRREFTGWQRLLTEAQILWQYLYNAFLPQPWRLGPFHDSYEAARSLLNPATLTAVAAWTLVLVLSVVWRRRYPLLSFAVLWFLGGHLLESTVVPLDLYFEHRNYMPIIGPVYALCIAVAAAGTSMKKIAYAGLSAYVALQALVLLGVTSLWGSPGEALTYWKSHFPNSRYAVTAVLPHQLSAEGPERMLKQLQALTSENSEFMDLKLYELKLSCEVRPQYDHTGLVDGLRRSLQHADFTYTTLSVLSDLTDYPDCNGVTNTTIGELALALNQNPRYERDPIYNHLHHMLMGQLAQQDGNFELAISHLKQAMKYRWTNDLNLMIVLTYISQQQFEEAHQHIEEARENAPLHPLRRYVWYTKLGELTELLTSSELRAG